jgi:hypothetical protein
MFLYLFFTAYRPPLVAKIWGVELFLAMLFQSIFPIAINVNVGVTGRFSYVAVSRYIALASLTVCISGSVNSPFNVVAGFKIFVVAFNGFAATCREFH